MLTGTNAYGFKVIRTQPLPELNAVMYHMVHERTRLELVWIKRDEENRTFGIAFPTALGALRFRALPGQGAVR